MAKYDLKTLTPPELLDCFEQPLEAFSFLAWDDGIPETVKGLPNARPTIPLFIFQFEGDKSPIILSSYSSIFVSSSVALELDQVDQFVRESHDLQIDDLELLASVSITHMLDPIDPMLQIQLKASKACIVHQHSGEIIAILLWFHFGSAVGFIIGPVGKLATIFGSYVDGAYQNAKENMHRGVFELFERVYAPPSRPAPSTLAEWDWFGP